MKNPKYAYRLNYTLGGTVFSHVAFSEIEMKKNELDSFCGYLAIKKLDELHPNANLLDEKLQSKKYGIYYNVDGNFFEFHQDQVIFLKEPETLDLNEVLHKFPSAQNGIPAQFNADSYKDYASFFHILSPSITQDSLPIHDQYKDVCLINVERMKACSPADMDLPF